MATCNHCEKDIPEGAEACECGAEAPVFYDDDGLDVSPKDE